MTPPRCQAMTAGIRFQFRTCRQPARAWLTLLTTLFIMIGAKGNESDDNVVDISYDEQVNTIISIQNACLQFIDSRSNVNNTENNCQPVWDGLLCWPETPPGTTATQQCPDYVLGFTTSENATRRCMSDGTWYVDRDRNTTWTDLSLCRGIRHNDMTISVVESHLGTLGLMYNVGYGISLTSLVLSVIIMIGFKKLHCPRNTIHLNLFFSFILRASISFMKENLLVKGLGFPGDVTRDKNNFLIFKNESTHWECKLFFACFNYILGANYMWIFAEGLYLHMILSVTVFSERGSLKWYILLGWASPLTFMIPWILVRLFKEDVLCWNTHPTPGYFWIMRGPIVLSIVVNFIFFLSIIRVLFTKLNAVNTQEAKKF
ncbi:secretin receptor-like, partial [Physella acuta]|uniref:secretin receptor-like n=1 Tax=Physella acuta TaxID=109671 RepID=UPI0027DDA514